MSDEHRSSVLPLTIRVPTWRDPGEYGEPFMPIEIRQEEGLRIILGDGVPNSDLLIERQENRWFIFVHPDEGDPVCYLSIDDNGVVRVEAENLNRDRDAEHGDIVFASVGREE